MLTVPLPIEQLHQVIENPQETYLIDYQNSRIHGKPFIFFLSNLNVSTRIHVDPLTTEELTDLLETYMEINTLFKCEELNVLTMMVLLHFMKLDVSDIATFKLPEDFLDHFVAKHPVLLSRYFAFCSSMVKYCDYISEITEDREHDMTGYDGTIDDPKFVGINVVWLFQIPSFFELFFSARKPEEYLQFYFPAFFEEYMFNGKNLFAYFIGDEENPNWLLLNKMALEKMDGQQSDTVSGDSGSQTGE